MTLSPAAPGASRTIERTVPPAVILAAGSGSRLRTNGHAPPKPLTELLGRSLIERSLLTCRAAGVRDVVVVVGYRADDVVRHLREIEPGCGVRVRIAHSDRWWLGNGTSALAAEPYVGHRFFLLMADHLFAAEFLSALLGLDDPSRSCALVVDGDLAFVPDLAEATKVRRLGERIAAIGKDLPVYDGVDTGVFLCRAPIFGALREAAARGDHSFSGAVEQLSARGAVGWVASDGRYWQDVDTPLDLAVARTYLLDRGDGLLGERLSVSREAVSR